MLNKTNFIKEIESIESNKNALSQIKERFEQKPFFIEYKGLCQVVNYSKYLFALISILCAVYFVQSVLMQAIGIEIVSLLLTIILLLLIELGKLKVLPTALRKFYAYGSMSYGLICFNLLLVALSVYLSVKGIEQYNTKELAIAPKTIKIDSIRNHYQAQAKLINKDYSLQISQAQAKLNEIPIKASWQVQTDKANAMLKENLTSQISTLLAQKSKALESIEQEKNSVLNESKESNLQEKAQANNNTSLNTLYLVCFAFLNEILSLFCLWFIIYFEYKSLKEIDLFNAQNDRITIAQKDLSSLFQYLKNGLIEPQFIPITQAISQAHTPSQEDYKEAYKGAKIGFNFGASGINTKTPINAQNGSKVGINTGINTNLQHAYNGINTGTGKEALSLKDRQFLEAYKNVIIDIEAGKKQSEILSQKYIVLDPRAGTGTYKLISKSTLQNIKRVLRNI